jgi:hypothetical protein
MFNLEKVTFFAGKNMGFPSFFSKNFFQNCKKTTTKEMADTNHGPVNYESCVGAVHSSSEKVHLQLKANTLKVVGVLKNIWL